VPTKWRGYLEATAKAGNTSAHRPLRVRDTLF
jgi:hypothetical protein